MKKLLVATGLFFLAGCAFVNSETYKKLDVGMSRDDVEGVLGNPTRCVNYYGSRECIWEAGEKEITVNYVNGKVVVFSQNGL